MTKTFKELLKEANQSPFFYVQEAVFNLMICMEQEEEEFLYKAIESMNKAKKLFKEQAND